MFFKPTVPQEVLDAVKQCSAPDLSLEQLKEICARIAPLIEADRMRQCDIVCQRATSNDEAGVQWLLSEPQRFPACYIGHTYSLNALDVAARFGHIKLMCDLATDSKYKYWSEIEQQWVQCQASPHSMYGAVEGGHLDILQELTAWFDGNEMLLRENLQSATTEEARAQLQAELDQLYYYRKDTTLTIRTVQGICSPPAGDQQQQQPWQDTDHFKVLKWFMDQHVKWDVRTIGAAAKAGHSELIQWLATNGAPVGENTYVCVQAILNSNQDQAIETLKLLFNNIKAPWKPETRGFAKKNGTSRSGEWMGLCEAAAAYGKFKVLKWLATDPEALLAKCQGQFEMRKEGDGKKATSIELTPWDDANDPGRVRRVAAAALELRTHDQMAQKVNWPADRAGEMGLAAGYRNSADVAESRGNAAAAEHYRKLAEEVEEEVQEYKKILEWLDTAESGYKQHVVKIRTQLNEYRRQLGLPEFRRKNDADFNDSDDAEDAVDADVAGPSG